MTTSGQCQYVGTKPGSEESRQSCKTFLLQQNLVDEHEAQRTSKRCGNSINSKSCKEAQPTFSLTEIIASEDYMYNPMRSRYALRTGTQDANARSYRAERRSQASR